MIRGSLWIFKEGIGFILGDNCFTMMRFSQVEYGVNLLPGSVSDFLVRVRWKTAL